MGGLSLLQDAAGVDIRSGELVLARYVTAPEVPAAEAPKPYLHPVRTLGGRAVTDFRPADHPWHHGIALAVPSVGAANLWGGPSWVATERRYVQLDNDGSMVARTTRVRGTTITQELEWRDAAGGLLAEEHRELRCGLADDQWWLDWSSVVTNTGPVALGLGSPAAHGRDLAGYGGVMWRTAPSFHGMPYLLGSEAMLGTEMPPRPGEELRGETARWAATSSADGATAVMIARDGSTRWFARSLEYPGFGPAPLFDEVELDRGDSFEFGVRCVFADGGLDRESLSRHVDPPQPERPPRAAPAAR
jgi:hypothetical protein